jgi:hypothetical protein
MVKAHPATEPIEDQSVQVALGNDAWILEESPPDRLLYLLSSRGVEKGFVALQEA